GRARRAEERRQGAHGSAASGGPYHRGDEGGRGGFETPCSAPVLVLQPGGVGLGHRKPTAMGRRRAAAPPPGDRALRIARSAQARGRCASIAGVSAVTTRADVAIFVPWRRGRHSSQSEAGRRRRSNTARINAGHDTRALQAWLGHKNIQHTVRYTELAPDRFKNFWREPYLFPDRPRVAWVRRFGHLATARFRANFTFCAVRRSSASNRTGRRLSAWPYRN